MEYACAQLREAFERGHTGIPGGRTAARPNYFNDAI
jgi:hypothetical protein